MSQICLKMTQIEGSTNRLKISKKGGSARSWLGFL